MTESYSLRVTHRYLWLPVRNEAPMRRLRIASERSEVRAFDIELADTGVDFWVPCDLGPWLGRDVTLAIDDVEDAGALLCEAIQSDAPVRAEGLYQETLRPQFHFSSQRGWINDPNGLVYYQGTYHLYYQHNPYGWKWGNMHWGHAVSTDLVHWTELGDALYPDALGTMFSGSAVVDWADTAGLQAGAEPPIVCMYTAAGEPFTQCLAASNDGGRTLVKFADNPVVGHIIGGNRDPKLIWHAASAQWVMALFLDGHEYALFASPDLRTWRELQRYTHGDDWECPDFFPLAVDGDPEDIRWLFWGAEGYYQLGSFDGDAFIPEGGIQRYNWGGNAYAAQTYSDIPAEDGRRIQVAWLRMTMPGMPFNGCMAFPCELTLRTTPEGVRLFSQPVRELEMLHRRAHHWANVGVAPGETPLEGVEGELFDIRAEFVPGTADEVGLVVLGVAVTYDVEAATLSCAGRTAPLPPVDGTVRVQILVDRASIEVFGNDGAVALPLGAIPPGADAAVALVAVGQGAVVRSLAVYELASAWA
ncbi:MAG: GH32 C-terminal domain-containing protein [Anaerolineae bacterium]|jgi:sucrose-6-phosphate hydrolase SacC (GH32 family)|nr:GH32 C-terminal domain-containing protein [Anaerolineae bacterium]